jgi:hypothetical protein
MGKGTPGWLEMRMRQMAYKTIHGLLESAKDVVDLIDQHFSQWAKMMPANNTANEATYTMVPDEKSTSKGTY